MMNGCQVDGCAEAITHDGMRYYLCDGHHGEYVSARTAYRITEGLWGSRVDHTRELSVMSWLEPRPLSPTAEFLTDGYPVNELGGE